ncbi:uroporphyrinogen decarboxylase family protein [Chloroflexota bacterium]
MSTSSRELVRSLLASKPVSRPPFIPYIASAAAHFMQVPVQQMYFDPTVLANSLQACQRLFKYDGIVVLYDTTLEAEACGCRLLWQEGEPPAVVSPILNRLDDMKTLDASKIKERGRVPVILEAAKRLAQTAGGDTAIMGAITGPITLGAHLMGPAFLSLPDSNHEAFERYMDFWGEVALTLVRNYGELNLDAIVLVDETLASLGQNHYAAIQPALKTLRNVARFYNIAVIISIREVSADKLQAFLRLEADGFSLLNPVFDRADNLPPAGTLIGACIPSSALLGSTEEVQMVTLDLHTKGQGKRFFITSESEVPQATPAANLHEVMRLLQEASTN